MDEILIFLFKRGAHTRPCRISTVELGEEIGMSQQNASKRLIELEKDGYVKRTRKGISLTKKTYNQMVRIYGDLKGVFEGKKMEIIGTVITGVGEGQYYLAMKEYKKQIKDKLGFVPYPGTLNIRLDQEDLWKREHLLQLEPIVIRGFKDKNRTYGDLFAYKCKLENLECAVIVPLRTHHGPDILELISPFDIKKKLRKKEGDRMRVVI